MIHRNVDHFFVLCAGYFHHVFNIFAENILDFNTLWVYTKIKTMKSISTKR